MRKSFLMGLAFLGCASTADAAPVLFSVNATFADGSVLTGSFDLDQSKFGNQFSNVSLTLIGGNHIDYAYNELSSQSIKQFTPTIMTLQFDNSAFNGAPATTFIDLTITLVPPAALRSTKAFDLINYTGGPLDGSSEIRDFVASPPFPETDTALVSGQISETPLPAALPLFAGGLGMVGFLARRKKQAVGA